MILFSGCLAVVISRSAPRLKRFWLLNKQAHRTGFTLQPFKVDKLDLGFEIQQRSTFGCLCAGFLSCLHKRYSLTHKEDGIVLYHNTFAELIFIYSSSLS